MALTPAVLLGGLSTWFLAVKREVTAPYLDEVFHVRQAQHYCRGHWDVWDAKITTPPGLYVLSYVASPLLGCSLSSLRLINAVCLLLLLLAITATYHERRRASSERTSVGRWQAYHSALNIVLFPPLFFVSALYYTDVPSTLSVIFFYWLFLRTLYAHRPTLIRGLAVIVLGLVSLTFRQTNIFWVAIAPAALTLIAELDRGHRVVRESMQRRAQGFGDTTLSVAKTSWEMGVVYDPPVADAYLEDYFRTTVSVAACGLRALTQPARVQSLLVRLAPYLTLLALFASFVIWNGGVVLGDKANHVATIHLAQMLYIWPFLAFFSWPLLLGHILLIPIVLLSQLAAKTGFEPLIIFRRRRDFLPRVAVLALWVFLCCLVVRFNTIVHPFTLADNRHYNFYVFRRLLRPWWVRYAVTPVYVLAAWACIDARASSSASAAIIIDNGARQAATASSCSEPTSANAAADEALTTHERSLRIPDGKSPATVSFVLVWLLTTALSLCTAPLVEPRYCILPFVFWRMHLSLASPADNLPSRDRDSRYATSSSSTSARDLLAAAVYDYRIVLETLWFLAINAATGYVFLRWKFTWPQELGTAQRFMW